MAERRCLNCDATLPEAARFCPRCSQRADTARLTLRDMMRDLLHAFVNIERGPLVFARALLTQPGVVAREYVQGRRRRHYGPFATLVVVAGFQALVVRWSGFQALSQLLSGASAELVYRNFNLLELVQLPLLAGACALLFRDARLRLPEHMVLVAYALSVRAAAMMGALAVALLASVTAPTVGQRLAFLAAWCVYFGWAASQFYAGARWRAWWRGALAAAICHALMHAALVAASGVYEA